MNNIEKAILNLISEKLLLACEVRDYFCSEMVILNLKYKKLFLIFGIKGG